MNLLRITTRSSKFFFRRISTSNQQRQQCWSSFAATSSVPFRYSCSDDDSFSSTHHDDESNRRKRTNDENLHSIITVPTSNNNTIAITRQFTSSSFLSATATPPPPPPHQEQKGPKRKKLSSRRKKEFIPRKAAIELTENAREFCIQILDSINQPPSNNDNDNQEQEQEKIIGIMLKYQQSSTGEPRMVFSFSFVKPSDINPKLDEGITLELENDGITPKSPSDTWNNGQMKLYIHQSAFLKVLGGTLDIRVYRDGSFVPVLYDKEGLEMDPNV